MQININVSYILILKFLRGPVRHAQSANQIAAFLKSNISVRKCRMKFILCMQININVSYVLILKVLEGMVRHAQPANQIAAFFKV